MPFPRNLLNESEELVLDLRPHWWYLMKPAVTTVVAVVLGIWVLAGGPDGSVGDVLRIAIAIGVVAALVWFGWTYVVWNTTMFVLTSDRIVSRRGVFSKQGIEIPLDRVNTVFFSQTVFERMLGLGDVAIESAGERGTETFSDIRKPSLVQKEIYVQMEGNENRKFDRVNRGPGDATTPVDPSSAIPGQIEKLAELHQRGVLSDAEYQQKKAELLDRM